MVGILITARLGSTRLQRKHLLQINGKPIMHYLIQRIISEFSPEILQKKLTVVIATTDEPENTEFAKLFGHEASIFYGSRQNIPLRHWQTMKQFSLEAALSIDGDDILCSPKGMRKVYDALMDGQSYVRTVNLPFGMNSMGYSLTFLENSLRNHQDDLLETGWGRIFDENAMFHIIVPLKNKNDERLRFTLDYQDDFAFFKKIIELFGKDIYQATDDQIIEGVLANNINEINQDINKQYWINFHQKMNEEKSFSPN